MRYNPVYDTWVAIAEKRQSRPLDYQKKDEKILSMERNPFCPFCEGNESKTPAELDVVTPHTQPERTLDNYRRPNGPGWMVRAIPNRYPFLESDSEPVIQSFGPYFSTPNTGIQEVLVDVPSHDASLGELTPEEFQYIIHFYHRRIHQLRKESRWCYVQLFKNQGPAAGASLHHLHSQLAALPFVPPIVVKEQAFLENYRQQNGKCWYCTVLEYELREKWRFVLETQYFVVFCPFASRFAGEVHILPKRHIPCFVQTTREELDDLAEVLRNVIRRVERIAGITEYNLVLKTSPWKYTSVGVQEDPNFHWRFELCPRTTHQAGFELGTGCWVNPLSPENAARKYRERSL